MSSSPSDVDTIASITNATIQTNRYLGIFIFVFGCMGNILNILLLKEKRFRSNPCAWLFHISSIASFVTFITGLIPRILSGWDADFTSRDPASCKFYAFLACISPTITLWLITVATIDRWLLSSMRVHRREMSTLKNAQRCTILVVFLSIGLYIQTFICFDINVSNTPVKCYSKSLGCRLVTDVSFGLISLLCPLFLMVLFGLLTIHNVRQSHRRVYHTTNIELVSTANNRNPSIISNNLIHKRKKIDRQLLIMLFFQVTLLTILTLPLTIHRFYSTLTLNNFKTALQKAIDSFSFSLVLLLTYFALGLPFYIYALTGVRVFRKALFKVLQNFRELIMHE